jgi:hypothetical protein
LEPHHRLELTLPRGRRRRKPLRWLAAALVLAVVGLVAYGLFQKQAPWAPLTGTEGGRAPEAEPPAAVPAPSAEPVLPATPGAGEPESPPEEPLPSLSESDTLVRDLAAGLSSQPSFSAWLAAGGLIQRFVAVVDNVAEGVTPRPNVVFLAPDAPFRVTTRNGRLYVDPRGYERYDGIADTIASLDPQRSIQIYRRLQPLCEDAYRELGHPESRFDDALVRASQTLLATPVVEGDIALTPKVVTYAFADPKLEALSPAQKHFLRMGPRNVRLIQGELRALVAALGVPDGSPPRGDRGSP